MTRERRPFSNGFGTGAPAGRAWQSRITSQLYQASSPGRRHSSALGSIVMSVLRSVSNPSNASGVPAARPPPGDTPPCCGLGPHGVPGWCHRLYSASNSARLSRHFLGMLHQTTSAGRSGFALVVGCPQQARSVAHVKGTGRQGDPCSCLQSRRSSDAGPCRRHGRFGRGSSIRIWRPFTRLWKLGWNSSRAFPFCPFVRAVLSDA